jgi:hypothetical protein
LRAAAELLRVAPLDIARLAGLARRERCGRTLAYIARAGFAYDAAGGVFWGELLTALGVQAPVAPGVLPHWSRFVVLQGVDRNRRALGHHWAGAAP